MKGIWARMALLGLAGWLASCASSSDLTLAVTATSINEFLSRRETLTPEPTAIATRVPPTASLPPATRSPTSTETAVPSPTPTATLQPTATPVGGGGSIVLRLPKAVYSARYDLAGEENLFIALPDGRELRPLTNGWRGINNGLSSSPDGRQLLVASYYSWRDTVADLYLVNLESADAIRLSSRYFVAQTLGSYTAYWQSDGIHIILIERTETANAIFRLNAETGDRRQVSQPGPNPIRLYPSADDALVYWVEGSVSGQNVYQLGRWQTSLSGSQEVMDRAPFTAAPTGDRIAVCCTSVTSLSGGDDLRIEEMNQSCDFGWSPEGERLWASQRVMYERNGKQYSSCSQQLVWSAVDGLVREMPAELGFGRPSWAPDGRRFLWSRFQASPLMVDVESLEVAPALGALDWIDWTRISSINGLWIPVTGSP